MNLFDINQTYLQIISEIEDMGGEATPGLEEALAITREDMLQKVTNYKWVIDKIQGEINLADNEIIRLEAFKDSRQKSIERLQYLLMQSLLLFGQEDNKGIKRLQCGTVTLSTRKSPPSVQIADEASIPDAYKTVDITVQNLDVETAQSLINSLTKKELPHKANIKPNKKKIGDDIKAGTPVEGASLISSVNLSIK
jgi:hypothetical protein